MITITPAPTPPLPPLTLFKSGSYTQVVPTGVATSATFGNGILYLGPMLITDTTTFTRIGAEVTSAGDAASTLTLCIYADLGPANHYPGALLFDSSVTGSASTILSNGLIGGASATVQEITVNWTLPPALYWIGGVLQGVTVTQPTFRSTNSTPWYTATAAIPTAGQFTYGVRQASVTGALPNPFVFGSTAVQLYRIFAKVA